MSVINKTILIVNDLLEKQIWIYVNKTTNLFIQMDV